MIPVYSVWINDHGTRCVAVCDTADSAVKWTAALKEYSPWIETTYRKGL